MQDGVELAYVEMTIPREAREDGRREGFQLISVPSHGNAHTGIHQISGRIKHSPSLPWTSVACHRFQKPAC